MFDYFTSFVFCVLFSGKTTALHTSYSLLPLQCIKVLQSNKILHNDCQHLYKERKFIAIQLLCIWVIHQINLLFHFENTQTYFACRLLKITNKRWDQLFCRGKHKSKSFFDPATIRRNECILAILKISSIMT